MKWTLLGDNNTSFFHRTNSLRFCLNWINSIDVERNIISDLTDIKVAIRGFYDRLFSKHASVPFLFRKLNFRGVSN